MKRFLKILLSSVLIAGVFACSADAAAYSTAGELLGSLLSAVNGNLATVYEKPTAVESPTEWKNAIAAATSSLTSSVTLNIKGFDEESYKLENISDYNMSISAEGTLRGDSARITYTFTYSPNYRIMRASEDSSLLSVLSNDELAALTKCRAIVNDNITVDMTDYEKELALHDYIVANYSYDIDAANGNVTDTVRAHSVTGMVLDGKGVCEAYANTFMLLCRMAGLNCDLATGTLDGTKHEWNVVELNGEYYNVDLTSDDPYPDKAGRIYHTCFNLSDTELSKTHTLDESNIKCTGERYNYYSYNNLVVSSADDLLILLNDKLDRGIRDITFKTQGYTLTNSDVLKTAAEGRGLYNIIVTGDYGKDTVFYVSYS